MQDLSGKKILLFCPKFFNYEKEIKSTLEKLGASVWWYDDRPSNTFISKAIIRINKNILSTKISKYYNNVLQNFKAEDVKFDYLFFVNPESITLSILKQFRAEYPSAKVLLYMWDSFRNRKQNLELLPLFDSKFTFDSKDAEEYGLKLRPLFYTEAYASDVQKTNKYDILFIGTAHTDRYNLVKLMTSGLKKEKLKLYFFLSSKLLYHTRKIIDRDFRKVKYDDISFKSLNHKDIALLMQQSIAVLDINHPKQIGLTMRTLETLGAKTKLITTNRDVLKYDFYNPTNILVIDRDVLLVNSDFFNTPVVPLPDNIMKKYSIEGWISEIFNLS